MNYWLQALISLFILPFPYYFDQGSLSDWSLDIACNDEMAKVWKMFLLQIAEMAVFKNRKVRNCWGIEKEVLEGIVRIMTEQVRRE